MRNKASLLFLFFLSSTMAFSQMDLQEGLIGRYPLGMNEFDNGYLLDISGNNNDAFSKNVHFLDEDVNQQVGNVTAIDSDKDSHFVINEDRHSSTVNELRNLSVSFWIMRGLDAGGADRYTPILSIFDENGNSHHLDFDNVDHSIRLGNTNDRDWERFSINSHTTVEKETWVHVAFTINFDFSESRLYVNGVEEAMTRLPANFPEQPKLLFGKDKYGKQAAYIICYDDLFVYNRILNKEEIAELAQQVSTSTIDLSGVSKSAKVYPNPSPMKRVYIELNRWGTDINLQLFDAKGSRLMNRQVQNGGPIELELPQAGHYFVRLQKGERHHTEQIIVH